MLDNQSLLHSKQTGYLSIDSQYSIDQAMISNDTDNENNETTEKDALEIEMDQKSNEELISNNKQNKQIANEVKENPEILSMQDSSSITTANATTAHVDTFYTHRAHILRRTYHVVMFTLLPIFYLWTAKPISDALDISTSKILSFIIVLQIILEYIRIQKRFIIYGQREYERDHICAQAWGTIASCIVFLIAFPRTYSIAPVIVYDENNRQTGSEAYACFGQIIIPIIWTLGFGDPLLGELKKYVRENRMPAYVMYIIVDVFLTLVWILCFLWLGTPFWLAIIIPPIAILAEKPSIQDIDDNGLMLLVPLLITVLLEPWFSRKCNSIFY